MPTQVTPQTFLPGRSLLASKSIMNLLKITWQEWTDDNGASLSAALAYYTVFSLAPILVIAVAVAGLVLGQEAARGELTQQVSGLVGKQGAALTQTMLANASTPSTGILAGALGLVTLLFGATGAFGQMQNSLNQIWNVLPTKSESMWIEVAVRFVSFLLVLGVGLLLLTMVILSTVLTALTDILGSAGVTFQMWGQVTNFVVSFAVTAVMFALVYKHLPDVEIEWRDVWLGAIVTSILFTIGNQLIGIYFGQANMESTYSAAGSLVIIMLWVYYSTQVLLLGAEFTQVYTRMFGSRRNERGMVSANQKTRAENSGVRGVYAPGPVSVQPFAGQAQTARGE